MSGHMQVSHAPTPEMHREHYDIERELSDRLRHASAGERRRLYSTVYDELHRRVTYLRYLDPVGGVDDGDGRPSRGLRIVRRYLRPQSVFLEIGAGDCSFSREVSAYVKQVYAVDVSEQAMAIGGTLPANVERRVTGGIDIPATNDSTDVAFSSNLIEHLHPDDAYEQTRNVFNALKPGGVYVCITPNRLYGPHDISGDFGDRIATGLHLREYTYRDLIALFEQVGFTDIKGYLDLRGRVVTPFPAVIATAVESLLMRLPAAVRARLMHPLPVRALLFVRVVAKKPLAT
ncbi:MAG: class I SAM-dependent methyltransferase [Thermomicrobiales bacterium]|nr:class I SAM-dependent methyltransferase [Thermomicrobiales bacterium]